MSLEVTPSPGPPRPPGGEKQPRIREGPYAKPKKQVAFSPDFPLGPQPEPMDSSASAPAAITPMEEQNTVPKRPREEDKGGKKKKALVVAQTPPSLPPPPPGGAAVLRAVDDDARTVAYEDDNYQDDVEDDDQTVAYGDQEPEELPEVPEVSAAAAPPKGDKRKEPEHVPLLPIQSNEPDDYTPVLQAEKKGKKSVLTPTRSSSSSKGPSISNQDIW
jgi:hypothetical protein